MAQDPGRGSVNRNFHDGVHSEAHWRGRGYCKADTTEEKQRRRRWKRRDSRRRKLSCAHATRHPHPATGHEYLERQLKASVDSSYHGNAPVVWTQGYSSRLPVLNSEESRT